MQENTNLLECETPQKIRNDDSDNRFHRIDARN